MKSSGSRGSLVSNSSRTPAVRRVAGGASPWLASTRSTALRSRVSSSPMRSLYVTPRKGRSGGAWPHRVAEVGLESPHGVGAAHGILADNGQDLLADVPSGGVVLAGVGQALQLGGGEGLALLRGAAWPGVWTRCRRPWWKRTLASRGR